MRPGDLVRVIRLPKYWGAADIRGCIGIILRFTSDDSREVRRWCVVLIDNRHYSIPTLYLETVHD